jgi:hypothetical protein
MKMTVLERFKIEIGKQYFPDTTYVMYLDENGLYAGDTYIKSQMQRQLLMTLLDCLQALANDIDLFRRVDTQFATTSDAYLNLRDRIEDIERRINSLAEPNTAVSYLFYN